MRALMIRSLGRAGSHRSAEIGDFRECAFAQHGFGKCFRPLKCRRRVFQGPLVKDCHGRFVLQRSAFQSGNELRRS